MLQYFQKIFLLKDDTLWVLAMQGACEVIQNGNQEGCHFEFYSKLETVKKQQKLKYFMLDIKLNTLLLYADIL